MRRGSVSRQEIAQGAGARSEGASERIANFRYGKPCVLSRQESLAGALCREE